MYFVIGENVFRLLCRAAESWSQLKAFSHELLDSAGPAKIDHAKERSFGEEGFQSS